MKIIYRLLLLVAAVAVINHRVVGQPPGPGADSGVQDGLSINEPEALQGYTLVFPLNSSTTYLVDMESRVVNQWKSDFNPALSAYLMPNGDLVRPGAEGGFGPGAGGRVQRFNWNGELVWDFSVQSLGRDLQPHHDIHPMPNGNVLMIAYEVKSAEDAEKVGRPTEGGEVQSDCILEIKPTGKTSGEVVWEWHAWDHLVQDVNKKRPGFADVSEHPELIDVNFGNDAFERMMQDPEALAKLRSLGYVGGGTPRPRDNDEDNGQDEDNDDDDDGPQGRGRDGGRRGRGGPTDWMHTNAIDYNAKLDQIMISVHGFSEFWIIDHSTTTEEAASHSGGKCGKGGDLIYRWGNPQAYRNGANVDRRLYQQHNAHWIPEGLPGAGHVLVFNNGGERPDGRYSSVDEIVLPLKDDGSYEREEFLAFGPDKAKWSYTAEDKTTFFSHFISGAHRLPNGNTLICSGAQSTIFEVTPEMKTVWRYKHPSGGGGGRGARGPGGMPGFELPRPGEIMPEFLQGMLRLSDDQKQAIAELQTEVDATLDEVLTEAQRKQLAEMHEMGRQAFGGPGRPGFGPPGFGPPGFGPPGGPDADRDRNGARPPQARAGRPDGDRDRPDGRGPDGRDGRNRGRGGGGPAGIFRSYRYAASYSAFDGRQLEPGELLADLVAAEAGPQDRRDGRRRPERGLDRRGRPDRPE